MSVFSEQITRLQNGLVNAKTGIEGLGGSVTVAGSSPTIEEIITGIGSIPQGGGGGQDYFALLEEVLDTVATDQPYRHIMLVSNANDQFTNTQTRGNSGLQWWTSDGAYYTGEKITHTWDKTKDTDNGMGFGSRWVLMSRSNEAGFVLGPEDIIYCVVDDGSMNSNSCLKTKYRMIGLKFRKPEKRTWSSTINNLNYAGLYSCNSLQVVDGMNFEGITTAGNGLQCRSIGVFKNTSNIGSDLSLIADHLTRDTMLNLFNALIEGSHTLTLGATCLSRLTDADKAIATGKGWTLA